MEVPTQFHATAHAHPYSSPACEATRFGPSGGGIQRSKVQASPHLQKTNRRMSPDAPEICPALHHLGNGHAAHLGLYTVWIIGNCSGRRPVYVAIGTLYVDLVQNMNSDDSYQQGDGIDSINNVS
jgi:hypothetical protein